MSKYIINIPYEGQKRLYFINDDLEAVKYAQNYEADLYINNKLVFSPLGLEREDNTMLLEKIGIETYIVNGQYHYRYQDPAKRKDTLYATFFVSNQYDKKHLEVQLYDYKKQSNIHKFNSFKELLKEIENKYIDKLEIDYKNISILAWVDLNYIKYKIGIELVDNKHVYHLIQKR